MAGLRLDALRTHLVPPKIITEVLIDRYIDPVALIRCLGDRQRRRWPQRCSLINQSGISNISHVNARLCREISPITRYLSPPITVTIHFRSSLAFATFWSVLIQSNSWWLPQIVSVFADAISIYISIYATAYITPKPSGNPCPSTTHHASPNPQDPSRSHRPWTQAARRRAAPLPRHPTIGAQARPVSRQDDLPGRLPLRPPPQQGGLDSQAGNPAHRRTRGCRRGRRYWGELGAVTRQARSTGWDQMVGVLLQRL